MQKKKAEVRNLILEVAKKEFLEKGFAKASLREIAAKAGVTKGNIYTYFKNKDELFCELVKPSMDFIRSSMPDSYGQDYVQMYLFKTDESAQASIDDFAKFVYALFDYKEGLSLLFFSSAGSSKENFREEIFNLYTEHAFMFNNSITEYVPGKKIQMSEMLIHTLASLYLRLIEEILIHEPDDQELVEYIKQMAVFVHYGFMSVINLQL
ncbi:MAG: TetR/AcrR family transcriptional regulator [Spirochaetales bacterium]|nr:TetR/AcrR family transcriptional regulator [Spirochaetales bacterium]